MWIRSQNKEKLVKVTSVNIFEYCKLGGNLYEIEGWNENCINKDDCWVLGSYNTKERAIDVLDEIQERTSILEVVKNSNTVQTMANFLCQKEFDEWCSTAFVYQMPEG